MTAKNEQPVPAPQSAERTGLRSSIVSSGVGTALEYFDFALYGLAAALVFNKIFFPDVAAITGLLISFATFGIGFIARPIGGVVIGYLGDRLGRRWVLMTTVGMMGLGTTLIGLLPTYHQIGVLAPILLVLLRLVQGFGAGAEMAGAGTLLSEVAPTKHRGLVASVVTAGTNLGSLSAAGAWMLVTLLPEDALLSWGWRIPFVLSFGVMAWTMWMRRRIVETGTQLGDTARKPMHTFYAEMFRDSKKALFQSVGMRIGETGTSTFYQVFFIGYISTVTSASRSVGTSAVLIASLFSFFCIFGAAHLSDKIGRRPVFRYISAFQILWIVPALLLANTGRLELIVVALIGGIAIGVVGMASIENSYLPELFGARHRLAGLAVSREIGGIIGGGLVPFVAAALLAVTHSWWPLAIYVGVLATISCATTFFTPETRGRDLTAVEDANALGRAPHVISTGPESETDRRDDSDEVRSRL